MGMQADILASAIRTDDGVLNDQAGNAIGRTRIKAIRIIPTASTAGTVVFKDGSASGTTRLNSQCFCRYNRGRLHVAPPRRLAVYLRYLC
jgi:hypothetical protein